MEKPTSSSYKRIGFHRVSDDSVSSMLILEIKINQLIEELEADTDIDHIWTRDFADDVDWESYPQDLVKENRFRCETHGLQDESIHYNSEYEC